MNELKYRLYGFIHLAAKKILGRSKLTTGNIFSSFSVKTGTSASKAISFWRSFINSSLIPDGLEHAGTLYAGYIGETKEWCLPSWIWTNAATVRMYCVTGMIPEAQKLAKHLADYQQESGGWIVRNDYDEFGAIPMLAPNDSAYIANNAFIELYLSTKKLKYLEIARRCADWIIETARPDGIVYTGYNMRDKKWDKNCVIVDTGFTGGLFSRLYEITHEEKYLNFLKCFIDKYIDLFYIPATHGFCTSIDKNDRQQGGMFGRGQAWALEGLIPAYLVLKDAKVKAVIDCTIDNLIQLQCKNGGWAYNLTKPLMGEDCKAISVIAKAMMEWYVITKDERCRQSAERALDWCRKHTAIEGEAKGGIFSFCIEGGVVQNLYTSCAFVYASAYAIELEQILKNIHEQNNYINKKSSGR